jgi:hypothetical protein
MAASSERKKIKMKGKENRFSQNLPTHNPTQIQLPGLTIVKLLELLLPLPLQPLVQQLPLLRRGKRSNRKKKAIAASCHRGRMQRNGARKKRPSITLREVYFS